MALIRPVTQWIVLINGQHSEYAVNQQIQTKLFSFSFQKRSKTMVGLLDSITQRIYFSQAASVNDIIQDMRVLAHKSTFGIFGFKICCLQIFSLKHQISRVKNDKIMLSSDLQILKTETSNLQSRKTPKFRQSSGKYAGSPRVLITVKISRTYSHKDPHQNVLMPWQPKVPEFDSTYM